MQTSYGLKERGDSRFVIVAPHAAGDDLHTGEISGNVADFLNAYLIVNNRFVKPTNSHARPDGSNVEDFNHLSWNGTTYSWSRKKPQMREFYDNILEYAEFASILSPDQRAIIAYIHGMGDRPDFLAIDIGCGLKYDESRLKGTQGTRDRHPEAGSNTGIVRATREDMEKLKDDLGRQVTSVDPRFRVGIGEYQAAWSRSNGIQYHAGTNDASFQLEINKTLRDNVTYTSRMVADALRSIYLR